MSTTALTIGLVVLAALVIALAVALALLWREVRDMRIESTTARAVADALRDGRDEEAVRELLQFLESTHARMEALSEHARALDETLGRFHERSKAHLQRIGVVRFDASEEVTAGLSCALCVLDAHSDGFLITTLYDLNRSRTFVRAVRDGRTDRELLPEEAEALQAAMAARPARVDQPAVKRTEQRPSPREAAPDESSTGVEPVAEAGEAAEAAADESERTDDA